VRRTALLTGWLWLAACGHSPDPIFYALSARQGNVVTARPLSIELRRPTLPSYLDRPHIVRRVTPERLALAADERWAAPLEEMFGATLAENLGERLPNAAVYAEAGSISATADVRVEVQVARFEMGSDGAVQLSAEVAVRWSGISQVPRLSRQALSATPASQSTADLVACMSFLLARLSDAIARTIETGPPAPLGSASAVPSATPATPEPALLTPPAPLGPGSQGAQSERRTLKLP
jgi:uncharacterized protein